MTLSLKTYRLFKHFVFSQSPEVGLHVLFLRGYGSRYLFQLLIYFAQHARPSEVTLMFKVIKFNFRVYNNSLAHGLGHNHVNCVCSVGGNLQNVHAQKRLLQKGTKYILAKT